jgi:chromate transporter
MIPRRTALAFWLKLGFISFGGPAGQIAIMHEELVEQRRWISENRFLHALNYCMVLPGPEAQQLATYLGWLMHGTWGGVAAGLLFVLPGMMILIALAWLYVSWGETPWVSAIFYGVKPAVVAIVMAAAWRIGARALRTPLLAAIAGGSFLAAAAGNAPFPMIVLAAALLGLTAGRLWPAQIASGGGHAARSAAHPSALIDDDTPLPAHARYSLPGLLRHAGSALVLWAAGIGACIAAVGIGGGLTRMAWFFTKAALLTFGGAYAVLPYVYDAAVEQYHWLAPEQMIDGLALGETTPGPLIMIVTFVGFLGGWQQAMLGPGSELGAALAGALVATFFTFLPSFLFILAGAPLIEATRHELRVAAPLAAITAAVVGVIVNLALLFARHAFWPGELTGSPDLPSAAIAVLAAVALIRFKASVPLLVLAAAAVGVGLRFSGVAI